MRDFSLNLIELQLTRRSLDRHSIADIPEHRIRCCIVAIICSIWSLSMARALFSCDAIHVGTFAGLAFLGLRYVLEAQISVSIWKLLIFK